MVINRLLSFIFLFLLLFGFSSFAQVTVPNYAFTGQEITNFKVRPSYTAIQFNFSMPSQMDIYLQKRKEELSSGDKRDYMSDEPGFIYKDPNSARFTSLFVGAKALRRYTVLRFCLRSHP